MSVISVVGGQWGDEGKGKIVDVLSSDVELVARYQGGANAGHTVYTEEGKIVLHQIPSGILRDNCVCILGNGMVVDPEGLYEEIRQVSKKNISIDNRLILSHNAHIVTPIHKAIDIHSEGKLKNPIGTTGKGIGPTYVDKFNRRGIRGIDLLNLEILRIKLYNRLESAIENFEIPLALKLELEEKIESYLKISEKISIYVSDVYEIIQSHLDNSQKILIEGAQGTLLDIDHGTYPYVTSSSPSTGGISTGLGLPLHRISRHIGIFKVYCTRVGEGPFPTELQDESGELLRKIGKEFGATTGRPRRCGWFDLPAAKFSVQVNGLTEIALTKLDVLDKFEKIKICTGYMINGKIQSGYSSSMCNLQEVEPIYTEFPGWRTSTVGFHHSENLPGKVKEYIRFLEESLGVPIKLISTGPARDQIIES
ncbi:MAG: adenylosuccinate synthase [Candidatus Marinimicrobia bacterium]|nr:adenylosuccinate synthase [Candidatus Neomarinimicrobiota bacterium]|tara:strand:- start:1668 stop:2936 length:1269 start_codon:yes stop_codon:yes gene_type:complete